MAERVVVAGVGVVPFAVPGASAKSFAERAIRKALDDASIDTELIDQAVSSHVRGEPSSGERALARAGVTGVAISNVSNGCASGSVALFHARQALLSGEAQCVVAVGFEDTAEAPHAASARLQTCAARLQLLAANMRSADETFARVAVKARAHAMRNPNAVHRAPVTIDDARAAPLVAGGLRRSYASDASCGAAAVVLCTPRFAALHGVRDDVLLVAHALESDDPIDAASRDAVEAIAAATTRRVAERAYESAGVDPTDVDVAEVHDCCVADELISCAALGLCAHDDIERFVRSGANTYGGSVVVSPSGGMLSNGDAPGATGIAQLCELAWQLRGEAGPRQVGGARIAVQHNGAPGAAVGVAVLRRAG